MGGREGGGDGREATRDKGLGVRAGRWVKVEDEGEGEGEGEARWNSEINENILILFII